MPLPYYEDDQREHLIRTEYRNLESSTWWKKLNLDGVVLYSWGAPRYRKIAKAIHDAGIKLHIHLDTSGDFEGPDWEYLSWIKKILRFTKVKLVDFFRARHLRYADVITASQPAAENISKRLFYGSWLIDKFVSMPTPVSSTCSYNGEPKENLIICVGRWDDKFQKRPEVLMATLEHFYDTHSDTVTRIYGNISPELAQWHARLPFHKAQRIELVGYQPNHKLREQYMRARVVLCTSRYEGSHVSSGEGLCCGCSVVTPPRHKGLHTVIWYTSFQSGTVAEADTPEALADALKHELDLWISDNRNPKRIATHWQSYFHVDKVFNKIFN